VCGGCAAARAQGAKDETRNELTSASKRRAARESNDAMDIETSLSEREAARPRDVAQAHTRTGSQITPARNGVPTRATHRRASPSHAARARG
jgi:hypothetical protein